MTAKKLKRRAVRYLLALAIPALSTTCSQPESTTGLPDLIVDDVSCMGGNLYMTIKNNGKAPLPEGWTALATLYVDGYLQEDIFLRSATSRTNGGIEQPGGQSHYLIPYDISSPVRVDIYLDYAETIDEENDDNNSLESIYVGPCVLPDLNIEDIYLDEECQVMVVIENRGPGRIPHNVWILDEEPQCVLTVFIDDKKRSSTMAHEFDPREDLHPVLGKAVFPTGLKLERKSTVKAVIDCSDIIQEQDESNNVKTVTLECGKAVSSPDRN